jgi:cytochrome c oxidase assembly protein subunit 15
MRAMRTRVDANGAAVLTVGFGTAVAMWAVGYFGRLPAVMLPSPALLGLLLAALLGGGLLLGVRAAAGFRAGLLAGGIAGLVNLLVLGSFLSGNRPGELVPSAAWWIPGSVVVSALLAGLGAELGRRARPARAGTPDWRAGFVRVAAAATLLLLAVGGLVTSTESGLAVVDWPNSFGYNMFLYPFSRMTGGIYYEHAHRLFGALVGLTTLVLAFFLQRVEPRAWVRRFAFAILALVIVQGLLGGLRVTGRLTTSTSPADLEPSLTLALIHGVLGQVVFGMLVALAAVTSPTWTNGPEPQRRASAVGDRALGIALVGLLLLQLALGAAQRHLQELLLIHIITGVVVVAPVVLHVGIRAMGLNDRQPLLRQLGLALLAALLIQVLLGLGAFVGSRGVEQGSLGATWDVSLTTAHQWFGAIVLALAVSLMCWNFKLLAPER